MASDLRPVTAEALQSLVRKYEFSCADRYSQFFASLPLSEHDDHDQAVQSAQQLSPFNRVNICKSVYRCSLCPFRTSQLDLFKSHLTRHSTTRMQNSVQTPTISCTLTKSGTQQTNFHCSFCNFLSSSLQDMNRHSVLHFSLIVSEPELEHSPANVDCDDENFQE